MQSFRYKISSASKKAVTLAEEGIEPLTVGYDNFHNPIKEVEILAKIRSVTCGNCELSVDEPIESLKVIDNRIESLSNKMCDLCGCTLSYKLRQSIIKCDKWLE